MAKLLVVDDEPSIRDVLGRILQIHGYVVDVVEDGDTALEVCRTALEQGAPYNLVIIDLNLPGDVNGKDIAASIRAIDPTIRFIVSSGSGHDPVMINYQDYGFSCAMLKPFQSRLMLETIERVLQTPS